jgi:hypothetical protein
VGFVFRKSKSLGGGARLNMSKRGPSVSQKVGPLTVNSRGRGSVRVAPGLSFRFGGKKRKRASAHKAVTFYQHPNCTVHHKTLQAAQRCAAKASPRVETQATVVSPPLVAVAGWYPCGGDPAGSVRYWDGAQWTSGFKP